MNELTTRPGASSCLHMIQGTSVFKRSAIFAAHRIYLCPASRNTGSTVVYSFSIYLTNRSKWIHNWEKNKYNISDWGTLYEVRTKNVDQIKQRTKNRSY